MNNSRTGQKENTFLRGGQAWMIGSDRTSLLRQIRGEGIVEMERTRNQRGREEENNTLGRINNLDDDINMIRSKIRRVTDRGNNEDERETEAKTILDNDDENGTHQHRFCPNVTPPWRRLHRAYVQTVKESTMGRTNLRNLTSTVASRKEFHGEGNLGGKGSKGIKVTVYGMETVSTDASRRRRLMMEGGRDKGAK